MKNKLPEDVRLVFDKLSKEDAKIIVEWLWLNLEDNEVCTSLALYFEAKAAE